MPKIEKLNGAKKILSFTYTWYIPVLKLPDHRLQKWIRIIFLCLCMKCKPQRSIMSGTSSTYMYTEGYEV